MSIKSLINQCLMTKSNVYGFWIDPSCNVIPILNAFEHIKIAKQLYENCGNDEQLMINMLNDGWIRIINTKQSFMVDYRCILTRRHLSVIKEVVNKLEEDGIFHTSFILTYGSDYHFFDTINDLIRRIKQRLYDE